MIINEKIPGWNNTEILRKLAEFSANVPENGAILELGGLFGRSTYALGHNKKNSVKLFTIDIWPTIYLDNHREIYFHDKRAGADETELITERLKNDPERLDGKDFHELWKLYTAGIDNLVGIKDYTTLDNKDFPMFDFIFHDAGHDFHNVYNDLVHWFPKLKDDGIIIIDDYESTNFPEVIKAVDIFVKNNNLQTEMVTHRNILLRRKI